MTNQLQIEQGTYRHAKSGRLYQVIGMARQTETDETLVIYQPLYESEFELFARPYTMFIESVAIDGLVQPRFAKVGSDA